MIITADKVISCINRPIHCPGAIVIRKDKILAVGSKNSILNKYAKSDRKILKLDNAVLLPGLVNLHTHLELPHLFKSIKAKDYTSWVLELLRTKRRFKFKDYLRAASQNVHCLIQSGTTTIGEISTHGASTQVIASCGLRAYIYNEIISMDPHRPSPPLRGMISKSTKLIRFGLSPHSPHTVSMSSLVKIRNFSERRHVPLSIHAAETRDESLLFLRKKNELERLYDTVGWRLDWAPTAESSIEYLDRIGILSPAVLLAHAVHLKHRDIIRLKDSGVSIAHCPRSNSALHVGRMRLKKFLDAAIPVGLGTDSLASVASLSLWDEMRFAYKIHRTDGLVPEDLLYMATLGGAKCLQLEKEIGTLEPGKQADIIAVQHPRTNGDFYSDLLKTTKSCIMSIVAGKIIGIFSPDLIRSSNM